MAEHNELGKKGEVIAKDYLLSKGYRILETNWYFNKNEIDIIAETRTHIVIIEVKTRSSFFESDPTITVSPKKQRYLVKATDYYLRENNIQKETRFDIITVIITNNQIFSIEHLEDAFYSTL